MRTPEKGDDLESRDGSSVMRWAGHTTGESCDGESYDIMSRMMGVGEPHDGHRAEHGAPVHACNSETDTNHGQTTAGVGGAGVRGGGTGIVRGGAGVGPTCGGGINLVVNSPEHAQEPRAPPKKRRNRTTNGQTQHGENRDKTVKRGVA